MTGLTEERLRALGFDSARAESLLGEINSDQTEIIRLYRDIRDFITLHASDDELSADAGPILRRMLILRRHYEGTIF